jgi:hypothetical protein
VCQAGGLLDAITLIGLFDIVNLMERAMYALVVHDWDGRLLVFSPFATEHDADEYRDEFGGGWKDWSLVEVIKPMY